MKNFTVLSAVEQIAEHLRKAILSGELQNTMPGVRSLATTLGVNHKTINAALAQLEKKGLLISQGQGLPREIVLPEDHTPPGLRIAILDFDSQSQGVNYMIDLRRRLEATGHLPFFTKKCLKSLGSDTTRIARYVKQISAEAWIIGAGHREILEWFAKQEKPAFAMFGGYDQVHIAATGPDKATPLAEVTRHLLALGHRRISFIARQEVRHPKPAKGILAFLNELEAAGITTGAFNLPNWEETREGFGRLLESFFDGPTPPTALILDEAFEFNACYHFISQRGLRIPNDISLVCTDYDPELGWCKPPVSHISWDYRPVVRRIVSWANNVAKGKDDREQYITKAEFVKGGTIGLARTF